MSVSQSRGCGSWHMEVRLRAVKICRLPAMFLNNPWLIAGRCSYTEFRSSEAVLFLSPAVRFYCSIFQQPWPKQIATAENFRAWHSHPHNGNDLGSRWWSRQGWYHRAWRFGSLARNGRRVWAQSAWVSLSLHAGNLGSHLAGYNKID